MDELSARETLERLRHPPWRERAIRLVQRRPNLVAFGAITGAASLSLLLMTTLWHRVPTGSPMGGATGSSAHLEPAPRPHLAATLVPRPDPAPDPFVEAALAEPAAAAPSQAEAVISRPVEAPRPEGARRATAHAIAPRPPAPPPPAPAPASAGHQPAARRATEVVIQHRAGSMPASQAATSLARTARRAGFKVAAVREKTRVPTSHVVRYFYSADAAAAETLARQLGADWETQDFRGFAHPRRKGVLEVWLPDP